MKVSLAQLAALVDGDLEGPADREVSGLKGIEEAGPQDVAFLGSPRFAKSLPGCKAGVVLVSRDQEVPQGLAVIRVDSPYLAYAKALTAATTKPYVAAGVHARAFVDDTAQVGPEVTVHALAYVGPGAKLGARVVLHSGVHVGEGAEVGDGTVLYPNVTLYHGCKIGKRCIIHGGSVIGADGYSFVLDGQRQYKIPQLGIVQIDDDVEIGALNTIDRAALDRTWIKSGVKTDNMVHIAHNCVVGENTLLVAQVGISGSTKLGRNVTLGGQAGVAGHIEIGDNVRAAGGTGIIKSVPEGEELGGVPAMPVRMWLRTSRLIRRLPELFNRLKAVEKRLDKKAGAKED